MIKNERQYRITRAKASEFAEALGELEEFAAPDGMHPRLKEAQEEALRSQYEELLDELSSYEALSERSVLELPSFDRLPQALIQARIAENLTQKDLAERLGCGRSNRSSVMRPQNTRRPRGSVLKPCSARSMQM